MISDSERTRSNGHGGGATASATRNGGVPSTAQNRQVDSPYFSSIWASSSRRTESRNSMPRSPSLEPSRENTHPKRTDIRGGRSLATSQSTPTGTACSSSRRVSRPTKRIGCLGSSSNMTRHRSRDAGRGVDGESRRGEERQMVKAFEMEMKRSKQKKSPLSNEKKYTAPETRGKPSDEMKNIGHSTLKGLSHQPLNNALQGSTWQKQDCRQHMEETQHPSTPSDAAPLKSTEYYHIQPLSSCVIAATPLMGEVNDCRRRSISRHRMNQCDRKNDHLSRDATPTGNTTERSSSTLSCMDKQIYRQDSMRHHHRHDANSVNGNAKSSAKLIKSASSSTGKTVESINTKETEALSDSTVFCRFNSVTERASMIPPAIQKELYDATDYIAFLSSRALPSKNHIANDALSSGLRYRRATVMEHPNNAIIYGCNEKGCCLRHPHVQLRKKKLMGGWNNLMSNCPECCVEEMRRLKRLQAHVSKSKSDAKSDAFNCHKTRGRRHAYDHEYSKQANPQLKLGSSTAENFSTRRSRSRSCSVRGDINGQRSRQDRSHINSSKRDKSQKFEFDIALDAHGNITCPRSVMRSSQSPSMKKSCVSIKSNKSAKSARSKSWKSSFAISKTSVSVSDLISRRMITRG